MDSLFSKIVRGEIPCYKIAENDRYFAFLDIRPLTEGHTLVIPKQEIDYVFDMDDDHISGLMVFSKKMARAIKLVIPCRKVGMAVIGLEVAHAHIHLIPMNRVGDLNFSRTPVEISPERMVEIASDIAGFIE
jgi:histidine triad (HIT) family protein